MKVTDSDRNKTLSADYFNRYRQYLKDIINSFKKSYKWKIQLTLANNFVSSIDSDEGRVIHSQK